jgi:DNA-binding NarL/FixJ family response regulator
MTTSAHKSAVIRLIVVEDHLLVRNLVVNALAGLTGFEVVAVASDAETAIELCRESRPNLVLLDAALPGRQGPEAVAALLKASPESRVLMFSGVRNPVALRRAFAGGARGFVSKAAPFEELVEAMRQVSAGQFFYGMGTRRMIQDIMSDLPGTREDKLLSMRERDVLAGIAQGKSSKEIAAVLGLSPYTIENHRRRIMDRTGVHSVAGLTLLAVEQGLISLGQSHRTAETGAVIGAESASAALA